jgi:CBS domain-containing protein
MQASAVKDISSVLEEKGHDVLQIEADATVLDAIKRMVESNVGALLVTEDGSVTGIVTERDYLRRVTLEGRTERETLVREIMTAPLVYVTPDTSVEECMAVMTEQRVRHVPVFTGDRELVGIVSIGDLVKFQSKQQSFQIKFLTEYIESG